MECWLYICLDDDEKSFVQLQLNCQSFLENIAGCGSAFS